MQKNTYFNPSSLKKIEELTWLNKSNTNFLWVYKEDPNQKDLIEEMMIDKLILNPRVLHATLEDVSILKFTGKERFHFLKKHFPLNKIVFLGVQPEDFGIQINFPKFQILKHLDFYFLKLDAPEKLGSLDKKHKLLLVDVLNGISQL